MPPDEGNAPKRLGLTQERISNVVELKLRSNGIKVLGSNEWGRLPQRPLVILRVLAQCLERLPLFLALARFGQKGVFFP